MFFHTEVDCFMHTLMCMHPALETTSAPQAHCGVAYGFFDNAQHFKLNILLQN